MQICFTYFPDSLNPNSNGQAVVGHKWVKYRNGEELDKEFFCDDFQVSTSSHSSTVFIQHLFVSVVLLLFCFGVYS